MAEHFDNSGMYIYELGGARGLAVQKKNWHLVRQCFGPSPLLAGVMPDLSRLRGKSNEESNGFEYGTGSLSVP